MSSLIKTLSVFPRERVIVSRERAKNSYATAPYLAAKLLAELPVGALFPALFGVITYPLCGLNPKPSRFLKYLGILTLESFASGALGLTVGAFAPSTEAASAIGPAGGCRSMCGWQCFVRIRLVPASLRVGAGR